ncbi:MAG: cytochrome c [Polyangiaceae bacterium]|nr:cytochrome c [Polyangiaceae bacterium]
MRSTAPTRGARAAASLLAGAALALAACDGSQATRTWQPTDHDQPVRQQGNAQMPAAPAQSANADMLVSFTWERDCSQCHGPGGRGDGPQAAMVHAPDLTRPEWQDAVTDEQIAAVVTQGRNKMPSFDLPPRTLQGIVRKVRSLRRGGPR